MACHKEVRREGPIERLRRVVRQTSASLGGQTMSLVPLSKRKVHLLCKVEVNWLFTLMPCDLINH
jgi:hypothetical protein